MSAIDDLRAVERAVERAAENSGSESLAKRARIEQEEQGPLLEPEDTSADTDADSGSDSDSDIEFVLGPAPGASASASASVAPPPAATATSIEQKASVAPQEATAEPEDKHGDSEAAEPKAPPPHIDIDKVGEYNGEPITKLPLSSFEDKPWRAPGANVADYFNYGFDELTWTAYCMKQDQLRAHLTPQRVYAMMGMPMMPMMPPMMPPMMMPGMPGFPSQQFNQPQ